MIRYFTLCFCIVISNLTIGQCGLDGDFMLPGDNIAQIIEVGPSGNIYIAHHTADANHAAILEKRDPSGAVLATLTLDNGLINDYITIEDIEFDKDNNVYVSGRWERAINFGGGYSFSTLSAGTQGFAAKLNSDLVVEWAIRTAEGFIYPSAEGGERISSIKVDTLGNCFISGGWENNFSLDTIDFSTASTAESFIAGLDINTGNVLWAYSVDHSYPYTSLLEVDQNGEFYLLSWSQYNYQIKVEKFDDQGNLLWNLTSSGGQNGLNASQIDTNGDLWFVGTVGDTIELGSFLIPNEYFKGIYLAKIEKGGEVLGLDRIASTGFLETIKIGPKSFDLQEGGTYYLSGWVSDNINFNGLLSDNGTNEEKFFVTKYDSLNTPIWYQSFGHSLDNAYEIGVRLVDDCNVFFYGTLKNSISIDTVEFIASEVTENRRLLIELDDENGNIIFEEDTFSDPFGENGVDIEELSLDFTIYPNPFSNELIIKIADGEYHVTVFDARGKKVIEQYVSGTSININMSEINPGLYAFKIEDIDNQQVGKVQKIIKSE